VRVDFPDAEPAHAALAPLWARARIADLSTAMLGADSTKRTSLEREITTLAVEHHLVSAYTSFVAVDSSRIVGNGMPARIVQPVELPEGVSYKAYLSEDAIGRPVRIGAWRMTLVPVRSGLRIVESGDSHVSRGAKLVAVNGAAVSTADELERVLAQTSSVVRLQFEPGGQITMRAP
jgi:hypothetical protein